MHQKHKKYFQKINEKIAETTENNNFNPDLEPRVKFYNAEKMPGSRSWTTFSIRLTNIGARLTLTYFSRRSL